MRKYQLMIVGVLVLGAVIWVVPFKIKMNNIQSFEDCIDAGYAMLESDPPQCRTPDGRFFTAELERSEEIVSKECGIENCHGLEISCGPDIPEACDLEYVFGDRCRQYASCQVINGECQLVVGKKFDQCKACVEKCLRDFESDTIKQFECESECE